MGISFLSGGNCFILKRVTSCTNNWETLLPPIVSSTSYYKGPYSQDVAVIFSPYLGWRNSNFHSIKNRGAPRKMKIKGKTFSAKQSKLLYHTSTCKLIPRQLWVKGPCKNNRRNTDIKAQQYKTVTRRMQKLWAWIMSPRIISWRVVYIPLETWYKDNCLYFYTDIFNA